MMLIDTQVIEKNIDGLNTQAWLLRVNDSPKAFALNKAHGRELKVETRK